MKVKCSDCVFAPLTCEMFAEILINERDFRNPEIFEIKTEHDSCEYYKRKWWHFFAPKGD